MGAGGEYRCSAFIASVPEAPLLVPTTCPEHRLLAHVSYFRLADDPEVERSTLRRSPRFAGETASAYAWEMTVELDHVFICVTRGAPEAEELVQFGLREGPSNVHPGQGTANRRFFFRNGMLELLWVEDPVEAQSERTTPTQLWERWSGRMSGACPFGILVRPANTETTTAPFPVQEYRPTWLPPDLRMYLAPAGVTEPMWVFVPFLRRSHHEKHFAVHPNGAGEITGLTLTTPLPFESSAAQALIEGAVFSVREGSDYLLVLELDHGSRQEHRDFRPRLPLVLTI